MEFLEYITVDNALKVIGLLSMVAAITPTNVDNAVLAFLTKAINYGAFNFWNAKNEEK